MRAENSGPTHLAHFEPLCRFYFLTNLVNKIWPAFCVGSAYKFRMGDPWKLLYRDAILLTSVLPQRVEDNPCVPNARRLAGVFPGQETSTDSRLPSAERPAHVSFIDPLEGHSVSETVKEKSQFVMKRPTVPRRSLHKCDPHIDDFQRNQTWQAPSSA